MSSPLLAAAIHDLHARLGSIRIAVTAVAGLELDAETRASMLTSASEESVRASAELAGLGALTTCLLDHSELSTCDVSAALHAAADAARLAGLDVHSAADSPVMVQLAAPRLQAVLPALIRLVAGSGRTVSVSVGRESDRVFVRFQRREPDRDLEDLPPVAGYLVDELGAQREADDDGLAFSLAPTP